MELKENNLQNDQSQTNGLILTEEQIQKLVLDAQNGDAEAFGKIYDYYVQKIYRYIYFKVDKQEALDLTESVFLKAWEHLKSYRRGQYGFSAWLFRIAHNLVVDFHRFNKYSAPLDHTLQDHKRESNPAFLAEQALNKADLKVAILKLKEVHRQVLILSYINELENHEIAHIMGKSEGGLRVIKHRALQELKRILKDMGVSY